MNGDSDVTIQVRSSMYAVHPGKFSRLRVQMHGFSWTIYSSSS